MDRRPVDRMALVAGLVFIVVGSVFLLERLGIVEVSPSFVVPLVLVALGIGLLTGRREVVREEGTADVEPPYAPPSGVIEEAHPEPTLPDIPPPTTERTDDDT